MSEYENIIIKAIINSNDPNKAVALLSAIVESIANGETFESLLPACPLAKP